MCNFVVSENTMIIVGTFTEISLRINTDKTHPPFSFFAVRAVEIDRQMYLFTDPKLKYCHVITMTIRCDAEIMKSCQ